MNLHWGPIFPSFYEDYRMLEFMGHKKWSYWVELYPPPTNIYEFLTHSASEYNLTWKNAHCRCNELRLHWSEVGP